MDIFEVFSRKISCQTSQGLVFARPLNEGWSTVSASNDPATVGEAALRALIGPKEKAGDETTLDDVFFNQLSAEDIQKLTHAVAKANRLGDLRLDANPYEGLGELILLKRQESRNEVQRLIDQARSATRLGPAFTSITKLPELRTPDFGSTPMNRAADASEEAAAHLKAGLLLWEQQQEADKKTADDNKRLSEANLAVARSSLKTAQHTMLITIGVAVVTLVAQLAQALWTESGSAEQFATQTKADTQRHEATLQVLNDQLATQQKLLIQREQKPPKR